jgi:anthranilate synthase/aminodeoxychorismate synthase-like glutamine amidotransferase
MILIVDNYDSFTYNIVQYLGFLGAELCVVRNDQMSLRDIQAMQPSHIVISPGPGDPDDSGVSLDVLREMGATTPIFGVCLGHQCIGQVYGGVVKRARLPMHGKVSLIQHNNDPMFAGMSTPFEATRYHSLIVEPETLPSCLEVTARTDDGEIMGLRHKEFPVYGVQFHPESILTPEGMQILRNFIEVPIALKV